MKTENNEQIFIIRYAKKLISQLNNRQINKRYIPNYLKPKMLYDEFGQYPYRCPICWSKYMFKEHCYKCLDKCWEKLPVFVWEHIDYEIQKPKEVSSWQWDLDKDHENWCGIVLYSNGQFKYFKSDKYIKLIDITEFELIQLLETESYLFQQGNFELPVKLKKYGNKNIIEYINTNSRITQLKEISGVE